MRWKEFSLSRKDGHPAPGQLCVVRRLCDGKAEYVVGQLIRDPRDKAAGRRIPHGGAAATPKSCGPPLTRPRR